MIKESFLRHYSLSKIYNQADYEKKKMQVEIITFMKKKMKEQSAVHKTMKLQIKRAALQKRINCSDDHHCSQRQSYQNLYYRYTPNHRLSLEKSDLPENEKYHGKQKVQIKKKYLTFPLRAIAQNQIKNTLGIDFENFLSTSFSSKMFKKIQLKENICLPSKEQQSHLEFKMKKISSQQKIKDQESQMEQNKLKNLFRKSNNTANSFFKRYDKLKRTTEKQNVIKFIELPYDNK